LCRAWQARLLSGFRQTVRERVMEGSSPLPPGPRGRRCFGDGGLQRTRSTNAGSPPSRSAYQCAHLGAGTRNRKCSDASAQASEDRGRQPINPNQRQSERLLSQNRCNRPAVHRAADRRHIPFRKNRLNNIVSSGCRTVSTG